MSATFCWAPVDSRAATLSVGAKSSFQRALEDNFGSFPVVLTRAAESWLCGYKAAGAEVTACDQLLDALGRHEAIRVWAEY